ncbi:alanine--tRNA ligase [Striga asiatica]|uniref:Alanine--tRNA ligase n=1 Tax=Striga asiatica TaxID=4170 RepID=A0A5A7RF41_STRAF|nr:alanine--tRNA ligase [Striga asiatica]
MADLEARYVFIREEDGHAARVRMGRKAQCEVGLRAFWVIVNPHACAQFVRPAKCFLKKVLSKAKEKIIAPVERHVILHTKPAPVTLVSRWRVCILLLLLHWQPKKPPPHLPGPAHQLRAHSMARRLKKTPLPAGPIDGGLCFSAYFDVFRQESTHVDNRDLEVVGNWARRNGPVRGLFYVAVGYGPNTTF